ncbi:LysR family transcriptional regulator [Burkholderia lata]|uniref:Transcriptional regulator, LysR family n=1 Tax=Burkholderia lata (strain ATCC 17760 / DSM 23089 / LMG 22485 / NCIMB 9086 / R18194 / 383) TaxID=482957 RepID=Q39M30_BURL3|nr:LysR family transcriptional regulator [Burkholderia lata]ABB06486.1 transcriptional regulator, LysR family [Burkholderia lata]
MDLIGSLTLDQLRVLVTISDVGSFSAAGRALGRVQSAISQSVRTLEETQGIELFDRTRQRPVLTPVGRALVEQARAVLASADRFEAIAAGTKTGLEPSITVAIDPLVPTAPLIASLRALHDAFPDLPVSFSTEGVGGAEQRLRDNAASLALCLLLPSIPDDLIAYPLMDLTLVPVAAADHPLVRLGRPLTRYDLESHVQLVLSDAYGAEGPRHGVIGRRIWRFVDLGRRLDFLRAGFGWCKMPPYIVEPYLADGSLVELDTADEALSPTGSLPIYAAHVRDRPLGRAGSWLLEDLRHRLKQSFDGES